MQNAERMQQTPNALLCLVAFCDAVRHGRLMTRIMEVPGVVREPSEASNDGMVDIELLDADECDVGSC